MTSDPSWYQYTPVEKAIYRWVFKKDFGALNTQVFLLTSHQTASPWSRKIDYLLLLVSIFIMIYILHILKSMAKLLI